MHIIGGQVQNLIYFNHHNHYFLNLLTLIFIYRVHWFSFIQIFKSNPHTLVYVLTSSIILIISFGCQTFVTFMRHYASRNILVTSIVILIIFCLLLDL